MANREWRGGLRAKTNLNGGAYPRAETCYVPATNAVDLYKGMLVKRDGSGSPDGKRPGVAYLPPADGGFPFGVIVGRQYSGTAPRDRKYLPAGEAGYLHVITLEDCVFEASVDGQLSAADIGLNIDLTAAAPTAGDKIYGLPNIKLNPATKAATATLPLRILGMKDVEDNDATADDALWLVSFNRQSHHEDAGA